MIEITEFSWQRTEHPIDHLSKPIIFEKTFYNMPWSSFSLQNGVFILLKYMDMTDINFFMEIFSPENFPRPTWCDFQHNFSALKIFKLNLKYKFFLWCLYLK